MPSEYPSQLPPPWDPDCGFKKFSWARSAAELIEVLAQHAGGPKSSPWYKPDVGVLGVWSPLPALQGVGAAGQRSGSSLAIL